MCTFTANAEVKDKPVKSADVISWPSNNIVHKGESVDLKGLQVKIIFEDGEEYVATYTDFTVDTFDNITEGSQLVTVRYGSYPVTIAIMVKEGTVSRLGVEVISKSRYVGDSFGKSDLKVVGYYDTGYVRELTDYTVSPGKLSSTTNNITVSYFGKETTFSVSAVENSCVSLQVVYDEDIKYNVGEVFEPRDVKVIAKLRRGEEVNVTGKCEYKAPDMTREGTLNVEVTYENIKTTYPITTVKYELESIDTSQYKEKGFVYLHFKDIKNPVKVKDGVTTSNDYTTNTKSYRIIWKGVMYSTEEELPEEEKRYIGECNVRVQVPVAVHIVSDKNGVLGYIPKHDLQNVSEVPVEITADLNSQIDYLHGFPMTLQLRPDTRTGFTLDIDNVKEFDVLTDFRVGLSVKLGVGDA